MEAGELTQNFILPLLSIFKTFIHHQKQQQKSMTELECEKQLALYSFS